MSAILLLHIIAGTVGLAAGYVALFSWKASNRHRAAGRLFVYSMVAMALGGAVIAAFEGVAPAINLPAALLTLYLVVTGFTTVRPYSPWSRRIDVGAMFTGAAIGIATLALAFNALARGGAPAGMAYPLFLFAGVALAAAAGDKRVVTVGALQGTARIRRHLWRMCFALFIAAMSFFLGQADTFPEPIRIRPLLAMPVLAVLVTMIYWLRRLRSKSSVHSNTGRSRHILAGANAS